jgi:hypothetical protein
MAGRAAVEGKESALQVPAGRYGGQASYQHMQIFRAGAMTKVGVRYADDSGKGSYVVVHAVCAIGNYDTLCGIDANDSVIGHLGLVTVSGTAPINCVTCKRIWEVAKQYRAKDFL